MTDQKVTIWQRINKPITWKILPWVIIFISILAYIFGFIPTPKKDQDKINRLESENQFLKKLNYDDSVFREIMVSKIDVLQNSFNNKETSKQIIYERIRNDVHHYDTASINEITRFFTDRYGKE